MRRIALFAFVLLLAWLAAPVRPTAAAGLKDLKLPPGYAIEVFARVPGARSLVVVPELDAVLVGSRESAVHAIVGKRRRVVKVLDGLSMPNGIAWKDGWLYVAETHRIGRWRAGSIDEIRGRELELLFTDLNPSRHHGWREATFGPDGLLYVAVGAPCNICKLEGTEGTIIRMAPDGSDAEVFARGIRNSVGMDFQPGTGHLFFTDNGADWMGDDSPPEELNRAEKPGLHFGYPWYGGGKDRTPDFEAEEPPAGVRMPMVTFGAHVAPLGVHFYRGKALPLQGDAIIAQHGSWNRSVPDGYRLVRVRFDAEGNPVSSGTFAEGWLQGRRSWGRPVDVNELPDGSLLVSDDKADAVYRITWGRSAK